MVNSLKYILAKKKMSQTELADAINYSKQQISKVIYHQRKVSDELQEKISEELNVPSSFFVDENRYCRLLTDDEVEELDMYFIKMDLEVDTKNQDLKLCLSQEQIKRERYLHIKSQTRKILKGISKDIDTPRTDDEIDSEDEYLGHIESNLLFYEKFVKLRNNFKIDSREWDDLWLALTLLTMSEENVDVLSVKPVVAELYKVLLKERKRIREEDKNFLEEFFDLK